MLFNFELPVYEVRAFFSIFEEGPYTVIQTVYSRYVLDKKSLPGDYGDRRIALIGDEEKPYKLYPLKKKISSISQLTLSKTRHFITTEGKLIKHTKSRYFDIVCKRVVSCTQIYNGKYQCYVSKINTPFITTSPYAYLSLIEFNNSYLLFDVHDSQPAKVRYRIKI